MTDDEHVQAFLDAEKRASELVEQLEKLRSATESHIESDRALGDASADLRQYAQKLGDLTTDVHSLVSTIRDMGVPEVLARLDKLDAEVADVRTQTVSAVSGLSDSTLGRIARLEIIAYVIGGTTVTGLLVLVLVIALQ